MNYATALKKLYSVVWRKCHPYPNEHLSAETARLKKIPFSSHRVFVRPSASDITRVVEFFSNIYVAQNYLNEAIRDNAPAVLVDVGANIGLSSLALISEFPTIKTVFGIEAEAENWGVLSRNYEFWAKMHPQIDFVPIHGIASSRRDVSFSRASLHDKHGRLTASGTFMFKPTSESTDNDGGRDEVVLIEELLARKGAEGGVVCKIDIEGGEQYLFEESCDWLSRVGFMTIEVHDRYDRELLSSSKGLIRKINEYDFAVVPEKDVLHCYARSIVGPSRGARA